MCLPAGGGKPCAWESHMGLHLSLYHLVIMWLSVDSLSLSFFFYKIEPLIPWWIVGSVRRVRGYITYRISQYSSNESRAQNTITDNNISFSWGLSWRPLSTHSLWYFTIRESLPAFSVFEIPILSVVCPLLVPYLINTHTYTMCLLL